MTQAISNEIIRLNKMITRKEQEISEHKEMLKFYETQAGFGKQTEIGEEKKK